MYPKCSSYSMLIWGSTILFTFIYIMVALIVGTILCVAGFDVDLMYVLIIGGVLWSIFIFYGIVDKYTSDILNEYEKIRNYYE